MKNLTKIFAIAAIVGTIFTAQNAVAVLAPVKVQVEAIDAGWENFLAKTATGYDSITAPWERFIEENTAVVIVPGNYDVLVSLSFNRLLGGSYKTLPKSTRSRDELAIAGFDKAIS